MGGDKSQTTSRAEGSFMEIRKDAASDQRLGCKNLNQTVTSKTETPSWELHPKKLSWACCIVEGGVTLLELQQWVCLVLGIL